MSQPIDTAEPARFDLTRGFLSKQEHMLTGLGLAPNFTTHPTTKGDANEAQWVTVLDRFLPGRYGVGPIFAIDSRGGQSDQIDLAIYDRQYSPLFFEQGDVQFVPAESVYAVFEVKPEMSKANLEYAAAKVESVRSLFRTSAPIAHAGGIFEPKDPKDKPILGGLLSTKWSWAATDSQSGIDAIGKSGLDFGIAVEAIAFDQTNGVELSPSGEQLIWFAMRLYRRLSKLGTVLAIDLDSYYPPTPAV